MVCGSKADKKINAPIALSFKDVNSSSSQPLPNSIVSPCQLFTLSLNNRANFLGLILSRFLLIQLVPQLEF